VYSLISWAIRSRFRWARTFDRRDKNVLKFTWACSCLFFVVEIRVGTIFVFSEKKMTSVYASTKLYNETLSHNSMHIQQSAHLRAAAVSCLCPRLSLLLPRSLPMFPQRGVRSAHVRKHAQSVQEVCVRRVRSCDGSNERDRRENTQQSKRTGTESAILDRPVSVSHACPRAPFPFTASYGCQARTRNDSSGQDSHGSKRQEEAAHRCASLLGLWCIRSTTSGSPEVALVLLSTKLRSWS